MNSGDDELERNRRAVQDQIDEATSSRPARTRTADDNDWEDENDDMDYEPTTGEDSDEMQEFFEQLLEDQEEEDDDENAEDEDFEGMFQTPHRYTLYRYSTSRRPRIFYD